ncbi:hypothetical protein PVL30_000177 [Lodderomyces elongisporus]|uniref:uncharacterized protein n=1 Tax=Lodderomyces elongisporus TaxID=36914 RepID=UPI0029207039|nr:uncharacterized protein PVL30_000177 [Lodderomyces elongisporus]WLF76475.1 hypothetical protein PVL30_000177 [Lodderomyces elongisporus]
MIKRVPKLYCHQLGKFKTDIQVPTHELLAKLGIISYPHSGLVHWGKTGLLIQDKINGIVRENLDHLGYEELKLSLLSHKNLWLQTGRWHQPDLFKLQNDEYLLAPTAEEEITEYVKRSIQSYKHLPVGYYQINEKFRAEKRPRGGLLRGREFLMKDAYSFDIDETSALKTYESMVNAYHNIFREIGVPYVKAQADSGDIGGDLSHEWHLLNQNGEDTVFTCDSCGHTSNVEKTIAYPTEEEIKNSKGGEEVAVKYFTTEDRDTLVCAYYPVNRQLEPKFMLEDIPDLDLKDKRSQEEIILAFEANENEFSKSVVRVMDARLNSRSNFPDFPINFTNKSMITTLTEVPIVLARAGEVCGECEEGHLQESNAIEIGHTFYLGEKYSKPLNLTVEVPTNDNGNTLESRFVKMGCYGIGISRIIAAVAEINRDDRGLRWPASIAPWEATIITDDASKVEAVESQLMQIDCRLDGRDERFGYKFKASTTMGIPLIIVLGKSFPRVEIEIRGILKHGWEEHLKSLNKEIDFVWDIEYKDGTPVKCFVEKDHLTFVVKQLLRFM